MSLLSSIRGWRQRRKAGQSRSDKKLAAARANLPTPNRKYSLGSPTSLLASLGDNDRRVLTNLFNATRSAAHPFCDGNTNVLGQLPCLQVLVAKKKLARLGLPEEVIPRATEFLEHFIREGMDPDNPERKNR